MGLDTKPPIPRSLDPTGENRDIDGRFAVMFVSMGQGDCCLIRCPDGKVGMIDCGSNNENAGYDAKKVLDKKKLREQVTAWTNYSNTLEFLVLTHSDEDHYNQLAKIFYDETDDIYTIKKIYYSGGPNVIGPESIYQQSSDLYAIKGKDKIEGGNLTPMKNYGDLEVNIFPHNDFKTSEVIEVVINNEMQRTYTYNKGQIANIFNGDKPNAYYGACKTIGNSLEVISGNSDKTGAWNISIVAGNVLKVGNPPAVGSKRRLDCREEPPIKRGWADQITPEVKAVIPPGTYGADIPNKPFEINSASLCTQINYTTPNEYALFMGDATNLTFKYLEGKDGLGNTCVLSNIPHHGSSNNCNDCTSGSATQMVISDFISKLKPQAAVVSAGVRSSHHIPQKTAVQKYLDEANDNPPGNDGNCGTNFLDVWVESTEEEILKVVNGWDPEDYYQPKKKEYKENPQGKWEKIEVDRSYYILKGDKQPETGYVAADLDKEYLLERIKTEKDVLSTSINTDSPVDLNADDSIYAGFDFLLKVIPSAS